MTAYAKSKCANIVFTLELACRLDGPAGRCQDSGAPKPARLPCGADGPEAGAALWSASEGLLARAGVAG